MTTLTIPNSRAESLLRALGEIGVRAPESVTHPTNLQTSELTWEPDLSAGDLALLAAIGKLALGATLLTPTERDALEPDIDGLRTYHGLASPTQAQTVLAVKALIRVLRALLRD